jgi:hypothetical protein
MKDTAKIKWEKKKTKKEKSDMLQFLKTQRKHKINTIIANKQNNNHHGRKKMKKYHRRKNKIKSIMGGKIIKKLIIILSVFVSLFLSLLTYTYHQEQPDRQLKHIELT